MCVKLDPWETERRPPCWPADGSSPNPCALAHFDHMTRNHLELRGPWAGWRMAGRDLVSPDGVRMSADRVRGIAWREEAEQRRNRARVRNEQRKASHRGMVTVIRLPVRDWHAERFGTRAG